MRGMVLTVRVTTLCRPAPGTAAQGSWSGSTRHAVDRQQVVARLDVDPGLAQADRGRPRPRERPPIRAMR